MRQRAHDVQRDLGADVLDDEEQAEPRALGLGRKAVEADHVLAHIGLDEQDGGFAGAQVLQRSGAAEGEIADAVHVENDVVLADLVHGSLQLADQGCVSGQIRSRSGKYVRYRAPSRVSTRWPATLACAPIRKSGKVRSRGVEVEAKAPLPHGFTAMLAFSRQSVKILDDNDPCLIIGHGTKFSSDFAPKWQILLPKSTGSLVAEVVDVVSDTRLRIKKEFGGESGKGTLRVREKIGEALASGSEGLEYKRLPYTDQQDMYRFVYKRLKEGGCIGIFPEGLMTDSIFLRF